jgi:two-component system LytT family response regulator
MTLRTIIVDDEELARDRLRRFLDAEPDVRIVAECPDGARAVRAILAERPDVVFLDVQMPGMDGFGVLREIRAEIEAGGFDAGALPLVVFVTAFNEHALHAFEVHAIDYVLKPIEAERIASAVARVRARRAQADAARRLRELERLAAGGMEADPAPDDPVAEATPLRGAGQPLARMVVKTRDKLIFVKVAEVDWIEAAGNYVRIHAGGQSHLVRDTLARLEAVLDPSQFARIHRSVIVNLDRVQQMEPWFSGEYVVLLHDGTQLKLSRWYRERVLERFAPGMGEISAGGPAE